MEISTNYFENFLFYGPLPIMDKGDQARPGRAKSFGPFVDISCFNLIMGLTLPYMFRMLKTLDR